MCPAIPSPSHATSPHRATNVPLLRPDDEQTLSALGWQKGLGTVTTDVNGGDGWIVIAMLAGRSLKASPDGLETVPVAMSATFARNPIRAKRLPGFINPRNRHATRKEGCPAAKKAAAPAKAAPQMTVTLKHLAAALSDSHELPKKQTKPCWAIW